MDILPSLYIINIITVQWRLIKRARRGKYGSDSSRRFVL